MLENANSGVNRSPHLLRRAAINSLCLHGDGALCQLPKDALNRNDFTSRWNALLIKKTGAEQLIRTSEIMSGFCLLYLAASYYIPALKRSHKRRNVISVKHHLVDEETTSCRRWLISSLSGMLSDRTNHHSGSTWQPTNQVYLKKTAAKLVYVHVYALSYNHHHTPQPFYGPFSGTTWVSQCQKRTSGLYGAREDWQRQTHRPSSWAPLHTD